MATPNTSYTDDPVCPHCGKRMRDAWELDLDDGDTQPTECGECEKPFTLVKHISVHYSTFVEANNG